MFGWLVFVSGSFLVVVLFFWRIYCRFYVFSYMSWCLLVDLCLVDSVLWTRVGGLCFVDLVGYICVVGFCFRWILS